MLCSKWEWDLQHTGCLIHRCGVEYSNVPAAGSTSRGYVIGSAVGVLHGIMTSSYYLVRSLKSEKCPEFRVWFQPTRMTERSSALPGG